MKHATKQPVKLFAAVLFFMLAANVTAQNATYNVIGLIAKESVIREYREDLFVVYGNGVVPSFNLVDFSSMTVQSIDMPGLVVNDFEIYNGFVYYCGKDAGTPSVGWFDISNTFSGSTSINKVLLPTIPCSEYPGYNHSITDLKRIEVMDVGGLMHLLIVGRAQCSTTPTQTDGFFADVYFDGLYWNIEATVDHSGIYFYDDVAVTDNYVIPVGHKNQSNGEYIYQLNKPTVPGIALFFANDIMPIIPQISGHTIYTYGGYYSYIVDGASEFIIEHIANDYFATACYGKCIPSGGSSYVSGTIFDLYSAVNTVTGRYCVSPYDYVYRDLKYNKLTHSLYLLPGPNSSIPNGYIEFFIDPTYSFVPYIQIHKDLSSMTKYNSLDACIYNFGHGQAILSGFDNYLALWRHNLFSEKNCTMSEKPQFDLETYLDQGFFYLDIWYDHSKLNVNPYFPNIINYNIVPKCQDER